MKIIQQPFFIGMICVFPPIMDAKTKVAIAGGKQAVSIESLIFI